MIEAEKQKHRRKQHQPKLAMHLPSIPFTGERFIPGYRDGSTELEHIHRYCMVLPLARGRRVLDIACGEGYGSDLIAQAANSVIGVELDTQVVDAASQRYERVNLNFRQGNILNIPVEDASCELVICFETIEHIADHAKAVAEMKRVMTADGVLVVSTPNSKKYRAGAAQPNLFHVKELTRSGLKQMLSAHFQHVTLYQQEVSFGSFILPPRLERRPLDKIEVLRLDSSTGAIKRNLAENEINEYMIALASDIVLPAPGASIYAGEYPSKPMSSLIGGVAERDGRIAELQSKIGEQEEQLRNLRDSLVQYDLSIKDLQMRSDSQLKAVREELDESTRRNRLFIEDIAGKDATIHALRELLAELERGYSDRLTVMAENKR